MGTCGIAFGVVTLLVTVGRGVVVVVVDGYVYIVVDGVVAEVTVVNGGV